MPYLIKYGLPLFIAVAVLGALFKAIVRPLKRQKVIEEAAELLRLTWVDEPTQELADLLDSVFCRCSPAVGWIQKVPNHRQALRQREGWGSANDATEEEGGLRWGLSLC